MARNSSVMQDLLPQLRDREDGVELAHDRALAIAMARTLHRHGDRQKGKYRRHSRELELAIAWDYACHADAC